MAQPFTYNPIATDSNFGPISLVLIDQRNGQAVDLTGASVTVNVADETTGEPIVQDGSGAVNADNPSLIEFFFGSDDVAKITCDSFWLVEWKLTAANGRVFRISPPCRLPVRRKL